MAWPDDVRKDQLRIEYYRGSGAGGQKRNKTSSACRITHLPTGHVGSCENHRSQSKNRTEAFRRLVDKHLKTLMLAAARVAPLREATSNERVRTYHGPRNTVIDHRVPDQAWQYDRVLDGGLDGIHSALIDKGRRMGDAD